MTHRTVSDVMSTEVISVRTTTRFHDIAALLATHRIGAVPVLNPDDTIAGVVSGTDLLHKVEYADGVDAGLLRRLTRRSSARKAEGRTATDVMTAPAVTVPGGSSIVAAAKLMDAAAVTHLPVVDDLGRLVGVVSRGDLLKVFLRTDDEIRHEVVHDVFGRQMWIGPTEVAVEVDHGIVTLRGTLEQKSLVTIAASLVHSVDGVVGVTNHLTYRVDDTKAPQPQYY